MYVLSKRHVSVSQWRTETVDTNLGKLVGVCRIYAVLGQRAAEPSGVVLRRSDAGDMRHRSLLLAGFLLGQRLVERPGAGSSLKVGGDGAARRGRPRVVGGGRRQVDVLLLICSDKTTRLPSNLRPTTCE